LVEGEMSMQKEIQARAPQSLILSPWLYSMYVYKWCPQTPGVHLALFADDTCLYATVRKKGFVLRKQQSGLSSMETWCERWCIKVSKEKTSLVDVDRLVPSYIEWMGHSIC
jgi:hypothetical protein